MLNLVQLGFSGFNFKKKNAYFLFSMKGIWMNFFLNRKTICFFLIGSFLSINFAVSRIAIPDNSKPSILLVHLAPTWGGISQYITKLYKNLLNDGYEVCVLIKENSKIQKEFDKQNLHYFTFKKNKKLFAESLLRSLIVVCSKRKIDIIHFNYPPQSHLVAKRIKELFPVKTLFTWHSPAIPAPEIISSFDYVAAVSKDVVDHIEDMNHCLRLKKKKVWHTPPCVDDERFLNFTTSQSSGAFFKKRFNIDIGDNPVVVMAASFTEYKNHECLLQAIHYLVYTLKTPVKLMLVGDGVLRGKIEKSIILLNLQNWVHILGFSDEVPAIFYHSDINVLSSKGESFGAVIVEAALLKKPIIVSDQIAAANYIIFNQKTGLLFKNNDPVDLALKIKVIIDNKDLQERLGKNVFELVRESFTSESLIKNIKKMYHDVYID